MRPLVVLAVMLAASAARGEDQPYKGGPVPPGMHVEKRRDEELVSSAGITMAGFWWLSMISASIGDMVCNGSCKDHSYDLLYVPLVGPAIAAAMPGVHRAGEAWQVILVADSVAQITAGAIALVAYLLPTKRVLVANETASTFRVAPGASGSLLGLTFTVTAF